MKTPSVCSTFWTHWAMWLCRTNEQNLTTHLKRLDLPDGNCCTQDTMIGSLASGFIQFSSS